MSKEAVLRCYLILALSSPCPAATSTNCSDIQYAYSALNNINEANTWFALKYESLCLTAMWNDRSSLAIQHISQANNKVKYFLRGYVTFHGNVVYAPQNYRNSVRPVYLVKQIRHAQVTNQLTTPPPSSLSFPPSVALKRFAKFYHRYILRVTSYTKTKQINEEFFTLDLHFHFWFRERTSIVQCASKAFESSWIT